MCLVLCLSALFTYHIHLVLLEDVLLEVLHEHVIEVASAQVAVGRGGEHLKFALREGNKGGLSGRMTDVNEHHLQLLILAQRLEDS